MNNKELLQQQLQESVQQYVQAIRNSKMQSSDQLTLGELIRTIEPYLQTHGEKGIAFDFGYMAPSGIDSWRGSYNELALAYKANHEITVQQFHEMLKNSIGAEFTGYKGGEYIMGETTPIWVANNGEACNTAVLGIIDEGYKLIISTGYRPY